MERRVDLNNEQLQAVHATDGPVMIVAGPGTGKTKTLTARISYLIDSGKARPDQILALTFTKKAAEEMKGRVAAQVAGNPNITTFHAFCYQLLDSELPFVTDAQRLQIIKSLPRPKTLKELSVRELGLAISRAKNSPDIADPDLAKIVRTYNKALAAQEVRDYDDLLLHAYDFLKDSAEDRGVVQNSYRYVLVDEFQDTNLLQYEILKLILKDANIFVIGDPYQSIYGFRGASGTIFDAFKGDFPNVTQVTLTINYRSVSQVVRLSNALFEDAPNLTTINEDAGLVRAVEVLNEYSEAQWVLNEIQRGIGGGDLLRAVSDDLRIYHRRLSDFAVLYRTRAAAHTFQKLLAESGLPYQVVGDGSPYDQPQIQAIITLMRAAVHKEPVDLQGYTSAEQRHLYDQLDKVEEAVPSILVERIIDILGIESSRELQQFASVLVRFRDVPGALRYFDEIAEHGFYDPAAEAVTLLTIHASKGLEFPHVFLIGAEEGILPSTRGDEAEEKRLFYVAATRARERLEITHAKNRAGQQATPSRFVKLLSHDILKRHVDPEMESQVRRIAKRLAKNSQQSLF